MPILILYYSYGRYVMFMYMPLPFHSICFGLKAYNNFDKLFFYFKTNNYITFKVSQQPYYAAVSHYLKLKFYKSVFLI